MQDFLWTIFTRFEPAADIHARSTSVHRFHVGLHPPVVIDCRMKPWYTKILEVDPATKEKVDRTIHKNHSGRMAMNDDRSVCRNILPNADLPPAEKPKN